MVRHYLKDFFVLFEGEIPKAKLSLNAFLLSSTSFVLLFILENELFLYLRTRKMLSLGEFVRCESYYHLKHEFLEYIELLMLNSHHIHSILH